MSLGNDWKETGKGIGKAFSNLGKTIIKSAKTGVDKVDEWANSNDQADKAEKPAPEVVESDTSDNN